MNQSSEMAQTHPKLHWLTEWGFRGFRLFSVLLGVSSILCYTILDSVFRNAFYICVILYICICNCIQTMAMTIFNKWDWIMDKTGHKRIIRDRVDDDDYLVRYYIFMKDRAQSFPFNIFIHKFLKSDPDDLHDHPWGFFTLILYGGYWEYTTEGKFWRAPGYFNKVDSSWTHRVELKKNTPCWTLFIPFQNNRKWGFYKNDEWIESDQYFAMRRAERHPISIRIN